MSTFNLQVVALDRVFYDGPCEALTVPAIDGEKGVLASHEPMVMAITAGEMRLRRRDSSKLLLSAAVLRRSRAIKLS